MSVKDILGSDGKILPFYITGGGGGSGTVTTVTAGAGLNVTGNANVNPTVNLGFQTAGDLIVGTGANAGQVLGIGTAGQVLRVDNAGAVDWETFAPGGVVSVTAGVNSGISITNTVQDPVVNMDFDAPGQLFYGGATANTATKLNVGVNGTVLTVANNVPSWASAPSGNANVIRVTSSGTTTIPVPNVLNEQLFVIDTASPGATFSWTQMTGQPADFSVVGTVPCVFHNVAGISYFVYGSLGSGATGKGVIYNVSPAFVWSQFAETDVGGYFTAGGNITYNTQAYSQPTNQDEYVFAGYFITINGNNCNGLILVEDNGSGMTITPLSGISGLPDNTDRPSVIAAVSATLAGAGVAFVCAFGRLANFRKVGFWNPAAGGTFSSFNPLVPATTGLGATADESDFVLSMYYTPAGALMIGGNFPSFQVVGTEIPNSASLCAVAFDTVAGSFTTVVPLTNMTPLKNNGASSIIVTQIGGTAVPLTNFAVVGCFVAPGNVSNGFLATDTNSFPTTMNVPTTVIVEKKIEVIAVDADNWVLNVAGTSLYGRDAGGNVIAFNQYGVEAFTWDYSTNGNPPLSYVGFSNSSGPATSGSGAWQNATTTNLDFSQANLRYAKADGTSGNATSAIISSKYSSLLLIGDTTNNLWDLMSQTGSIQYTP